MSEERATIRPVTLARLVEGAYVCEKLPQSTETVENELDVTHRRARETILEGLRIGLLREVHSENTDQDRSDELYQTTDLGRGFLENIRQQNWREISSLLESKSPHYGAFIQATEDIGPAPGDDILHYLNDTHSRSKYDFNQTTIDLVADWGERLGRIQRNAFTGDIYILEQRPVRSDFSSILVSTFESLEEKTGLSLRQRYLSIPEIREHCCQKMGCSRTGFDQAIVALAKNNVGKIELSGAPIDTGAKDAKYGIKKISLVEGDGLVSTSHATDQIMNGVEQFGKRYYYLALHDKDLGFSMEAIQ